MTNFEEFNTFLVQSIGNKVGAVAPTITPSAAFAYESCEMAEKIFSGEVDLPFYARMGNPTNAKLESILANMEGGGSAIVTSSGMGAMSMVTTAFLESGDEILCIGGFFGGTYTLVNETLKRFGVKNSFCDIDDFSHIEKKLEMGVMMVLIESVGNPSLKVPDIQKIAKLCDEYKTLLIVDNTVTPILLQPLKIGADIVVYSSTKSISGHSAALGGVAVFRDVKDDDKLYHSKYDSVKKIVNKKSKKAFVAICKKRAMRDFGMSANAFGSFLTMLGLETLALRVERVNKNVARVVEILDKKLAKDISVNHPSLKKDPYYDRYIKNYPNGCGPLFTLECGDKKRAFEILDRLKYAIKTANIGDNRTLALHMASTIYSDFDKESKEYNGVTDGLIRVSIGLEDPDVIAKDFIQACKM